MQVTVGCMVPGIIAARWLVIVPSFHMLRDFRVFYVLVYE